MYKYVQYKWNVTRDFVPQILLVNKFSCFLFMYLFYLKRFLIRFRGKFEHIRIGPKLISKKTGVEKSCVTVPLNYFFSFVFNKAEV